MVVLAVSEDAGSSQSYALAKIGIESRPSSNHAQRKAVALCLRQPLVAAFACHNAVVSSWNAFCMLMAVGGWVRPEAAGLESSRNMEVLGTCRYACWARQQNSMIHIMTNYSNEASTMRPAALRRVTRH